MARKPQQLSIPSLRDFTRTEHGGRLRAGKRKLARPVATRRPMHLVLRASRARGKWSMLTPDHNAIVLDVVHGSGRRFDVKVLRLANVGNHLHLIVKAKTREGFRGFLRTVSGLIARRITGAKKGRALPRGRVVSGGRALAPGQAGSHPVPDSERKFWDALAFSRVIHWGRDLKIARDYVYQNALEAFGVATKRKSGNTLVLGNAIVWTGDG